MAGPVYHVISVKPNKSGSGSMRISAYETTFTGENVNLKWLVASAFEVRSEQVSGMPPWAESQHWDITAKIVDPDPAMKDRKLTRQQDRTEFQSRLQSILRDRFDIKYHLETVSAPIFRLVVARGDSKLRPAIQAEEGHAGMFVINQAFEATAIPIQSLTEFLAGVTGRNVEDKTGLKGNFDLELRWSKDDEPVVRADNGAADRPPDIYAVVEEQLGLKLAPDKGPVKRVVVDAVQQPSPD